MSELENRIVEITQAEQKKKKSENSLRDIQYNIKHLNICIRGVLQEKRERKREADALFEKK